MATKTALQFDTVNFAKDLKKFARMQGMSVEKAVNKLSVVAYREIVKGTPIRTGNAKRSWRRRKISDTLYVISSAVVYMVPLEYGHSDQAPNGMVRITLRQLSKEIREHIK
jgi:hypothetical protein